MFFENAFGVAASGCMGRKDGDSDGGIKILGDNQMDNLEGNQQEQVNSKDSSELGYEKCIQVSKKTYKRVVYQD